MYQSKLQQQVTCSCTPHPSDVSLSYPCWCGCRATLLLLLCLLRFWINNQSRMYLLEGTADLQHHLHLKMGDVLIFAQKEDSTIVLAGRPPTKADAIKKPTMRKASPSPLGRPAGGRREAVSGLDWQRHA